MRDPLLFILGERLLAEHDVDAGEKQFELRARKFSDACRKQSFIDGENLGNIGDRIFGQAGEACRQP